MGAMSDVRTSQGRAGVGVRTDRRTYQCVWEVPIVDGRGLAEAERRSLCEIETRLRQESEEPGGTCQPE